MEDQHITKLDNETLYMNLHTIVFPDTKHKKEHIDKCAEEHKAVANYIVHGLVNVIFAKEEDAIDFYHKLNG